jgi:hypothetical protein
MTEKEEIQKVTCAAQRLSVNEDFILVIERLREVFKVDDPSAIIASFETNQTMFYDGHKAVFRYLEKVINGVYLDEVSHEDQPGEKEKFYSKHQIK